MTTIGHQPSSRDSTAGAGWQSCSGPGTWSADVPADVQRLSWLRPRTLWISRNDVIAKYLYDPVDRARVQWVRAARDRGTAEGWDDDFVARRGDDLDAVSFLLLGDPGEGDESQWAVTTPLVSHAAGAAFTVIASDVIYPTGEMADYREKYYLPWRALETPIFAVPGNHDWYDGLHGFMHHLCGLDAPESPLGATPGVRGTLARLLWRRSSRPGDAALEAMRREREKPSQVADPPQPAPYWAIDAGPVRIVGIDTGIVGSLDAEQGEWLRRVSYGSEEPKILVTGKPLIVNARCVWGPIAGSAQTVDDIVRDPRANYVAAIGGDTHNYQRYPVRLPDGRTLQYVVSGGGGAYTHATHQIPKVDLEGCEEADFRCYPLRGDSLARFSQIYDRKLCGGRGILAIAPDEASQYLSGLLGIPTTRPATAPLSRRARRTARFIQPLPAAHGFHRKASEIFDWNDPPFFKHFLRLDVTREEIRVRCFGVSGCAESELDPPVEDAFTIPL